MLTEERRPSIPLADAAALGRPAARTRLVRVVLGALLVLLFLLALALADRLPRLSGDTPPTSGSGVIALDLSSSVGPATYKDIRKALGRITATKAHLGVLIFSDGAYEVVPPTSEPADLAPIARFFQPHTVPSRPTPFPPRLVENPRFYENPWSTSYHGGTRISSGLQLARRILERDGIHHGRVILISDLNDSQLDQASLTETVLSFARDSIPLQIVDLSPSGTDKRFYEQLLGRSVAVTFSAPSRASAPRFPLWLVVAGVLLVLALAANELWCGRLSWRARMPEAAG